MSFESIVNALGQEADSLLRHECRLLPKSSTTQPSPYHVENIFRGSDRSEKTILNLHRLYGSGNLADTGYLSIFPVDQGVEHTAGFSFTKNPIYFDPLKIVELAVEAGCSGVASTLGVLGLAAKQYASKIPFILKINHNELLTYPEKHDEILFAQVHQAVQLGAAGVGATIYFGSKESGRQITEISKVFAEAHAAGLFTILWCYPRNSAFQRPNGSVETAADLTGQANHLGVTIQADIIKQKLPTLARGFSALNYSKYSDEMYDRLIGDHPIDWVRYQVANCYNGRISLINSGGEFGGESDVQTAIRTAVINKRGGGSGLIMGRKVFNRSFQDGVSLIKAVQEVYLEPQITIA